MAVALVTVAPVDLEAVAVPMVKAVAMLGPLVILLLALVVFMVAAVVAQMMDSLALLTLALEPEAAER